MKIGIIGLPQSGKKNLFEALCACGLPDDASGHKALKHITEIKDERFDRLAEIYQPAKRTPARIEIELLPSIEKEAILQGELFKDIAETDALCIVIRAFENDEVYHVKGSVDPLRDIQDIKAELILNDLLFIEKRLERIEKSLKGKKEEGLIKEKGLLLKFREHLEKGLPLRIYGLNENDKKIISSYPFVTLKKAIVILNVSEDKLSSDTLLQQVDEIMNDAETMQAALKVESEIARLSSPEEKQEFQEALGIDEPAIKRICALCIRVLDLISFFTIASDDLRQWLIKRGASAPEAAGIIHTDMQRGFIRAQVIKYQDILKLGSEAKVKEEGLLYIKGKDYIVEDGDILHIRFNV